MAPEPAGEGMMEGKSTITLAKAMVLAREKSKLEKRRARYKRYYDSHPGAMQKKKKGLLPGTPGYYPCEEQGIERAEENEYGNRVCGCHHVRTGEGPYYFQDLRVLG